MDYLLNEELSRMQVLAGLAKPKHDFEIFLEKHNHLSLGKMVELLLEANNEEIGKKAKDYLENEDEKIQKAAAAAASKISQEDGDYENLTTDEISDKIANLAPGGEIRNYSIKQRLVAATMALLLASNSLGVTSWMGKQIFKAKEGNKIEVGQTKKAQKQLDDRNTANFKDSANTAKATKINPNLKPTEGDEAGSLQYKTSGYKIDGKQAQELDQHGEDLVKVVKDGNSVKVHAKSSYSNQPNDPDNENKSVDGKKLDDARANSFKQFQKQSVKKALDKSGLKYEETKDGFKVQTSKGTKNITIDSKVASGEGTANKVGDVDQGTVFNDEVVGSSNHLATDFQLLLKNPPLPRMPKQGNEPKTQPSGEKGGEDVKTGETARPNPKGEEIANIAIKSQNRDKEILALLKIANPEIEWNNTTKPIIQKIRRKPDELIKKMSSVLGIDLGTRQKSTGAFKRSGLAEMLEIDDLNEAAIDSDLVKLGVTDEAIKANKDAIAKVIKAMYLLGGGNTQSTGTNQNKPISPDVKTVNKIFNANSSLKSAIERIDTEQELISLLTDISKYINKDFTKTSSNIVSTFNTIKTDIPKFYSNKGNQYFSNDTYGNVKEAETSTPMDTKNVETKIDQISGLKDALNRINTRDEFRDFIVNTILANINPKLAQDKSKMVNIMSRMISILSSTNLK